MLSSTSSISSLGLAPGSNSPSSSSRISRTYKQASQLLITRRVIEALQVLDPIIRPATTASTPSGSEDHHSYGKLDDSANPSNDTWSNGHSYADAANGVAPSSASTASSDEITAFSSASKAPISTASRAARVKVWSLYISILNSIVEMNAEEGKQGLGASKYADIVKRVRDGSVWEDIVRWGYDDNPAAVDAEVISNLATLLLTQANSQKLTQSRLENYLSSSSGIPSASTLASQIERSSTSSNSRNVASTTSNNGTSTPRDLGSRLKIIEIYALHVLPANEEWDYAKEFINMSDVLDEERREAFVNALEALREERSVEGRKERELAAQRAREQEAEHERQRRETEARESKAREEKAEQQRRREEHSRTTQGNGRTAANELDFGVDKSKLNGAPKAARSTNASATSSSVKASSSSSAAAKKRPRAPPPTLYGRASLLLTAVQRSLFSIGSNLSSHPVALLRMVLFMLALTMALARQDVRQRLKNARDTAYDKVKRTIGMGVKVSYL